jgi:exopolysaccharide production protein ExoQ
MFAKLLNSPRKIFFTLLLFSLTDNFNPFINFLSSKPYIRRTVNFFTGIPVNAAGNAFRFLWKEIFSLSLEVAFWFILLMFIFRPELFTRVRKMLWKNWGIAALLALACLSWFWSIAPNNTLSGAYLGIKITLVGIYISQAYSMEEILDMLVSVVALASIFSIFAIWLLPEWGIRPPGLSNSGWQGIFSYKNYMGRIMAFGNAMLIVYWFKSSDSFIFKRLSILGLFILTGILLVFSNSATSLLAWMGMYAALFLYGFWTKWVVHFSKRAQRFTLLTGIAAGVLLALNNRLIFALVNRAPTLTGRIDLWQILWTWFQKRPMLGFGYNAFWQQLPDGLLGWARHAHNGYIEIALGLGLPGLVAFLVALIIAWKRSATLPDLKNGKVIFLWPLLVLMYFTLANITYSIAFGFPDFHWALFIMVAGVVTPLQPKSSGQQVLAQIPTARETL